MPPSECVVRRSVTVFQRMSMSGWWSMSSAKRGHGVHVGERVGEVLAAARLHELVPLAFPGDAAAQRGVDSVGVEDLHGRSLQGEQRVTTGPPLGRTLEGE